MNDAYDRPARPISPTHVALGVNQSGNLAQNRFVPYDDETVIKHAWMVRWAPGGNIPRLPTTEADCARLAAAEAKRERRRLRDARNAKK